MKLAQLQLDELQSKSQVDVRYKRFGSGLFTVQASDWKDADGYPNFTVSN